MCSLTIRRMHSLWRSVYMPPASGICTHLGAPCLLCPTLGQNVFSYYRMCSLTIRHMHSPGRSCLLCPTLGQNVFSYYRMCSLTIRHMHSPGRSCLLCPTLAGTGVLQKQGLDVFSYYRMCSLTIECVLFRRTAKARTFSRGRACWQHFLTRKRTHSIVREHIL